MTGRRWESIAIAGTPGARCARGIAVAAFCVLLALSASAAGAAQAEPQAPKGRDGAVSDSGAVLGPMVVRAENDTVRISFTGKGKLTYHLSVSETPPGAVLRVENAVFDSLGPKVLIGDGTVDSVEFTRIGPDAVISLKLARAAGVSAQSVKDGLELVVGQAQAAKPIVTPAQAQAPAEVVSPVAAKSPFSVKSEESQLTFTLGSAPQKIDSFLLSDGLRLVVDLQGATVPGGQYVSDYEQGRIAKVAMRQSGENVRCVIEARGFGNFEGYALVKTADGFSVRLGAKPQPREVVAETKPGPAQPPQAVAAAAKATDAKGGGSVTELGFHQDAQKSYVDIVLSKQAEYLVSETTDKRMVLDIKDTSLSKKYERALDTSEFNGPISMISAYHRGPHTRIVVDLKKSAPFKVEAGETGLAIAFEGGQGGEAASAQLEEREKIVLLTPDGKKIEPAAPVAAGQAAAQAPQGQLPVELGKKTKDGKPIYSGQRISMDFVEADIRNILRIIGEMSSLNIVAGSEVNGKMTIRLVDIPWDQALDVILKAKGLDKEIDGNVMRIVAAEKLAGERAAKAAGEIAETKAREDITPLVSDIIPVSYADAKSVLDNVKPLLSKRGSVSIDTRTNVILLRDLPDNIELAKKMVARLDSPTPQVLIEARIVEVSSSYTKDLGIQWGGSFNADPSRGNAPSNGFPNSIGLRGGADPAGLSNWAVNLPAATQGAGVSLSLGSVNDILNLDLRLSALETNGKVRLISSPRVTTLDNKAAEISQGTQIPVSTATQEKIENQLVDYLLKLTVTPHVTSDNSILLKLEIKKDDLAGESIQTSGSSAPPKSTRAASTEVLVRDGDTTVIGGIITDSDRNNESNVPWFGKLPVIGWLFRSKTTQTQKTELIIFITPRIMRLDVAKNAK